jgi:hypothetical protein
VRRGPIDPDGRDARKFPDYYQYVLAHSPFENVIRMSPRVCVGPIQYVGQALVQRDIANLKSAMARHQFVEGFLPSTSPITNTSNEYYRSQEEFAAAYADAVREEYRAILDAGLVVQIDDPSMVSAWDSRHDLNVEEYRRNAERRVELLNYALRDLPQDRIRYHTCYGVNFGPRVSDLQLEQVIDIFFHINAGAYSFEAANPRHEHEWRHQRGRLFLRGCEPATRARVAPVRHGQAAGRQSPHSRDGDALQRYDRAPPSGRGPDRTLGEGGRTGEHHRGQRLRFRLDRG